MEFYSAVKKNEIVKLSGKWMETRKKLGNPERQASHVLLYLGVLAPDLYMWVYNLE